MKECKLSSLIRNIERMLKLAKSSYTACWTFLATIPTIFQNILFSLIFSLLPQALYYQLILISRLVNEFLSPKQFFQRIFTKPFRKILKFSKRDHFPQPLCPLNYCLKANTVQSSWIIVLFQRRSSHFVSRIYFKGRTSTNSKVLIQSNRARESKLHREITSLFIDPDECLKPICELLRFLVGKRPL